MGGKSKKKNPKKKMTPEEAKKTRADLMKALKTNNPKKKLKEQKAPKDSKVEKQTQEVPESKPTADWLKQTQDYVANNDMGDADSHFEDSDSEWSVSETHH